MFDINGFHLCLLDCLIFYVYISAWFPVFPLFFQAKRLEFILRPYNPFIVFFIFIHRHLSPPVAFVSLENCSAADGTNIHASSEECSFTPGEFKHTDEHANAPMNTHTV